MGEGQRGDQPGYGRVQVAGQERERHLGFEGGVQGPLERVGRLLEEELHLEEGLLLLISTSRVARWPCYSAAAVPAAAAATSRRLE